MTKKPTVFSLPFAMIAAEGHMAVGQQLYEAFENMVFRPRSDGEHVDMQEAFRLAAPAVLNMSLCLEILLKAHHFQTSGTYPRGHNVSELAGMLPEESLVKIRDEYMRIGDDRSIPDGVSFRFTFMEPDTLSEQRRRSEYDFSTFDAAVEYVGDMYKWFRYFYEDLTDRGSVFVSFEPIYRSAIAVHRVARDYRGSTKVFIDLSKS